MMPDLESLTCNKRRMVPVTSNTVSTDALLLPHKVLTIIHNGQSYQLRITSKNKLILTK